MGLHSYVVASSTRWRSRRNVVRGDATGIVAAQQAITCLRLVACGDVAMGSMWFTRSSRFDVGLGSGRMRGGWPVPTLGRSQYRLTRAIAREVARSPARCAIPGGARLRKGARQPRRALQFFLSSYDRFSRPPGLSVVDTITAAEAVLGSEIANTFKLAFRVAGCWPNECRAGAGVR